MVTNKADTIKKVPAITDTAADHPAETAGHHPGAANIPIAQQDTTYTASMDHHTSQIDINEAPHHTTSVPLQLQFKNLM